MTTPAERAAMAIVFDAINHMPAEKRIQYIAAIIAAEYEPVLRMAGRFLSFAPTNEYLKGAGRDDGKPRATHFTCELTDTEIIQLRAALGKEKGMV